ASNEPKMTSPTVKHLKTRTQDSRVKINLATSPAFARLKARAVRSCSRFNRLFLLAHGMQLCFFRVNELMHRKLFESVHPLGERLEGRACDRTLRQRLLAFVLLVLLVVVVLRTTQTRVNFNSGNNTNQHEPLNVPASRASASAQRRVLRLLQPARAWYC